MVFRQLPETRKKNTRRHQKQPHAWNIWLCWSNYCTHRGDHAFGHAGFQNPLPLLLQFLVGPVKLVSHLLQLRRRGRHLPVLGGDGVLETLLKVLQPDVQRILLTLHLLQLSCHQVQLLAGLGQALLQTGATSLFVCGCMQVFFLSVCVCVCVCVCVWERERKWGRERGADRQTECVCVCVWINQLTDILFNVSLQQGEIRPPQNLHVCVCVRLGDVGGVLWYVHACA